MPLHPHMPVDGWRLDTPDPRGVEDQPADPCPNHLEPAATCPACLTCTDCGQRKATLGVLRRHRGRAHQAAVA